MVINMSEKPFKWEGKLSTQPAKDNTITAVCNDCGFKGDIKEFKLEINADVEREEDYVWRSQTVEI